MLEIRQKVNINGYEEYIPVNGCDKNNILIVEAFEKGKVIGFGIFAYDGIEVLLYDVESYGDTYLFDGIVRAIIFKAAMKGIDIARFHLKDLSIVIQLGFLKSGENIIPSINEVLNNCCNCKKSL